VNAHCLKPWFGEFDQQSRKQVGAACTWSFRLSFSGERSHARLVSTCKSLQQKSNKNKKCSWMASLLLVPANPDRTSLLHARTHARTHAHTHAHQVPPSLLIPSCLALSFPKNQNDLSWCHFLAVTLQRRGLNASHVTRTPDLRYPGHLFC
jgi:hypothetical protein